MTQEALAEAVGVHSQAVSNWERGAHAPTRANLNEIATTLDVNAHLLMVGMLPEAVADSSRRGRAVRERAPAPFGGRPSPLIPPGAYQLVFDYCKLLEEAGVDEDVIEEARRLMSGETFNTLRKHMVDERTEAGWVKDVKAAWAFIKDSLKAQGYDL
jgi:transcriptional regulator with XRE-family HTH domain